EIERAVQVRDSVLRGGGVRVARNPYDRHAEQNTVEDVFQNTAATLATTAGTMIRCAGCSASLGSNLHDHSDRAVVGRVYASQASTASYRDLFAGMKDGTTVMGKTSAMPRSPSPFRDLTP